MSALFALPRNAHRIQELAKKQAATITLGQLMQGTKDDPESLIQQGRWLHELLPIRFARRINEFIQLPYVVVVNPCFDKVFVKYMEVFDALSAFPEIRTSSDEAEFCDLIRKQLATHSHVAHLIAQGYWEVRQSYPHILLDSFLDNLFATRISTRILLENYVHMRNPKPGHTGVVQIELYPVSIIKRVAEDLSRLTRALYGCCPEIEFRGNLQCTLDYIPYHVSVIVREVLKNALRATVERHLHTCGGIGEERLPPVVVELQKGDVTVIIKVSDQGGGMSKALQQEVWSYGWSSVSQNAASPSGNEAMKELAGYGFGLPLTRLYAQYFGGDVFMQALLGHGTDMYLLLNHLKEGTPSTEIDDPATALTVNENSR